MPKNSIFSPSAKINICTLSKAPPQSDHIINMHTHKISENLRMDFHGTTSILVYRPKHTSDLKNSNFGYAGFQEKFATPPPKLSQVSESSTHPLQNYRYAFFCSPPGQGVMSTNLLPVIATRMEPSYTHIPTSIKVGRA